MHIFVRGLGLLSLGLVSFLGCSSPTTGSRDAGPVDESDIPARYAQALCPNMSDCCKKYSYAHDDQTCQASVEAQARALLLAQQGLATKYDADAMAQCLDAYATLLKGCGTVDRSVTDVCDRVFVGTLPEGAACKESSECIDTPNANSYCENGTCQKDSTVEPVHAAANEECSGTCTSEATGSYTCTGTVAEDPARCFTNDGLICDTATKRCVPAPELGESCNYSDGCAPGGYCEALACVAEKASGPCSDSRTCTSASYCDFSQPAGASQCLPKKVDGEACTSGEQCVVSNCESGKCGPHVPVSAGLCAGLLND